MVTWSDHDVENEVIPKKLEAAVCHGFTNKKLPGRCLPVVVALLGLILLRPTLGVAAPVINEILFNPPGTDAPHEYIELRGTAHEQLPAGTYFIALEGDTNGNPGTVQTLFDLSGRSCGGNGFLVLLQKGHNYSAVFGSSVLVHTGSGSGFGNGSSSTVRHEGEDTDIENASVTFLLVQSPTKPAVGTDLDADNNGTLDGPIATGWTVLDSVGVLDADGAGDFIYGAISFRRNTAPGNTAGASGTIAPAAFTPDYVGRTGNTTGSSAADWAAGDDITGAAGIFSLGSAGDTSPNTVAGAPLNHIGGPNFNAPKLPGIIINEPGGATLLTEGGAAVSYTISANTSSGDSVTVRLDAPPQTEISTDQGVSFGSSRTLTLNSTALQTVRVRAPDNNIIDTSPYVRSITHNIIASVDPRYPVGMFIPPVKARVMENDLLLLNEIKVNPPGPDQPYEFIELRGPANAVLTNIYFVGVDGDDGADPGTAAVVIDLKRQRLGNNGLLVIVADGHPYHTPVGTAVMLASQLSRPGGALGNGTASFLLIASPVPIVEGTDLDDGDNGLLEKLHEDATILDGLGWFGGSDPDDIVYGSVVLTQTSGTPDAAARFPGENTPNSTDSWFNGDLSGLNGDSLVYDELNVGPDFPFGTVMTPGLANNTAPVISPLAPLSGAMGDPTNPEVVFLVSDEETPPESIMVTASSSNPDVAPNGNLLVTSLGDGIHTLRIIPTGVGYTTITLTASDGTMTWNTAFSYAASAAGNASTRWHTSISDASGAIPINSQLMFVADDENQTIRIYNRQLSGSPLTGFDFTPFLGLTDIENGFPREVDIEGATRVGNRIFWIGSHSHANISEVRTNRSKIFATDVSGSGAASTLAYAGRYEHLKDDLVAWDNSNGHGKGVAYYGFADSAAGGTDPKSPAGLNIEGLTMAPGSSTTAYVAFRAPIAPATNRFYALIVPVLNFATLAIGDGPSGSALFGTPIELDLYGRGIRTIEGGPNGYLIVGGSSGDQATPYPNDFKIYTWTGQPADQPQQRAADLSGLNPEAIVELPPGPFTATSEVQLLSDNGRTVYYGDDVVGKKLTIPTFKKFRSDVVQLGAVVKPAPIILTTVMQGGGMMIKWRALKGLSYRVQYKPSLNAGPWFDLPGDVAATGPIASKFDPVITGEQRFYHVVALP